MPSGPVPFKNSELALWMDNFAAKLPGHAAALPLEADVVAAAVADCAFLSYCISPYGSSRRNGAAEATTYIDLIKNGPRGTPAGGIPAVPALPAAPATVEPGVRLRLIDLAQVIKRLPGYNAAIGQDLGIITTVGGERPEAPTLIIAKAIAGEVTFKWNKGGWTAVKVQSRLAGTNNWLDLGTDYFSPFVDVRPLTAPNTPEVREYRACYLDKDAPTNVWSDVLVVTVQP